MNEVPSVESDLKVRVRYVGVKETKYDNICHTRTIWHGEGDEQEVPIAVAAQLARFQKVWEIVKETGDGAATVPVNTRFAGANGDPDHGVVTVDSVAPDADMRGAGTPRKILTLPKKKG